MTGSPTPPLDSHKQSNAEDFLKMEYKQLSEWAVHSEDVAHRIFNFYVSILTASLGGLFILIQLIVTSPQVALLVIAGTCGLLFMFGVVFYDSLVAVNIRSAYYRTSILSIQNYFRIYPIVKQVLVQLPTYHTHNEPENRVSVGKRYVMVDFSFPGGNQQPLMAGINSLLLGVLIWTLTWGIGGIGYRLLSVSLLSAASVIISLLAHSQLSRIMVTQNMLDMESRFSQHQFPEEADPD
ncbi:MAG: hypothetical protein JXJ17_00995 [Anaerolineae bacterium]|nr:hypothetical protein [Anaerolineae bacterium]